MRQLSGPILLPCLNGPFTIVNASNTRPICGMSVRSQPGDERITDPATERPFAATPEGRPDGSVAALIAEYEWHRKVPAVYEPEYRFPVLRIPSWQKWTLSLRYLKRKVTRSVNQCSPSHRMP